MREITGGIYPTMITPYKDNKIDYNAVEKLLDWYIEKGCDGVFAVCQSSEMMFLSLKERVELAKFIVDYIDGRIPIVASGHCGESLDEQYDEINAIYETGVDAFVLVTNRLDLHNDGDDIWIDNAEKLLSKVDKSIPLGLYECPNPYKRLLSERIIKWCIETDRFRFIKDTCCDPDMLTARGEMLKGTGCLLFNANEQTFLHSLKNGGSGYSGIMANFHPDLLSWLYENYLKSPEKAESLSNILSMAAFTENPAYPCTAKYYLDKFENISMDYGARSSDEKRLTSYQRLVVEQMYRLHCDLRKWLEL